MAPKTGIAASRRAILSGDRSWIPDALCAQTGPDDHSWFPAKGGSTSEAKRLCNGHTKPNGYEVDPCPVKEQCLAYALGLGIREGVWGGLGERQRRRLARSQERGAA